MLVDFALLIPWVPEVFFLVGGNRIERRNREGESGSGEKKKIIWHQRITISLPCRRQFPLIDIRSKKKQSRPDDEPLIIQRMEIGTETK